MNSRVLLYAIAGIDEAYLRESEQFDAIAAEMKLEKKRLAQRMTAVGIALVLCVAVFFVIKKTPRFPGPHAPNGTGDVAAEQGNVPSPPSNDADHPYLQQTTDNEKNSGAANDPANRVPQTTPTTEAPGNAVQPATDDPRTERNTEGTTPADLPVTTTKADPPSQPAAAEDPASPTEEPTEPSTTNSDPGGTPGSVFTNVTVSYAEAKEDFGHPIVSCASGDFTGYEVGVVSRNGNTDAEGAICLSVTYEFINGSISLQDQDRMTGSVAHHAGDRYEYGGRTFYVQTHDEAYLDYYYEIGYFPSADSGIAYQAYFDEEADVYEIMDLIISLEI